MNASATPLPGQPHDAEGPVFGAPWEAQAFALALALHEGGVFAWPEFATALTAAIRAATRAAQDGGNSDSNSNSDSDSDTGITGSDHYYHHWLDALESLVLSKGLSSAEQLHALEHAWEDAAARTPHGLPVVLNDAERALAR